PEAPSPQAAAAYSDAGTLILDRGWTGVCVVLALALILIIAAFQTAQNMPRERWTTAFTVAIPGVLAVAGAYALLGDLLQNHPAAFTFWVIVAFGLSASPQIMLPFVRRAREWRSARRSS